MSRDFWHLVFHQTASSDPIRGSLEHFFISGQLSWSYLSFRSSPWCRLHRGVDQKVSSLEILSQHQFQAICLLSFWSFVALGSVKNLHWLDSNGIGSRYLVHQERGPFLEKLFTNCPRNQIVLENTLTGTGETVWWKNQLRKSCDTVSLRLLTINLLTVWN